MEQIPKGLKIIGFIIGGLIIFYLLIRLVVSLVSTRPDTLGVSNGKLSPCPSYPACVSSQSAENDTDHYVKPIGNDVSVAAAKQKIEEIAGQLAGAVLIESTDQYLNYEIKVAPFGFVDDLEFYFHGDNLPIEVRSSARVPYYDFNVNRDRVESIRSAFE